MDKLKMKLKLLKYAKMDLKSIDKILQSYLDKYNMEICDYEDLAIISIVLYEKRRQMENKGDFNEK